jgi:hypothetical protein
VLFQPASPTHHLAFREYAPVMGLYDPGRQQSWDRIVHRLRAITGLGTLVLVIAVAGPVLLKELPPYALLLAIAPAMTFLLTWLFREPPQGWQRPVDDERLERRYQRMRKSSVVHIALFGSISLLFILLILAGIFRLH